MKHKAKYILATLLFAVLSVANFAVATPAYAANDANKQAVCESLGSANCTPSANATTVNDVITTVVNLLSFLIGAVAVIMIILAGFKYVTAAGDSSKLSSAKSTLIYALVGLAVAALAQVLVKYVLDKV